jgi:hypothetical protein
LQVVDQSFDLEDIFFAAGKIDVNLDALPSGFPWD